MKKSSNTADVEVIRDGAGSYAGFILTLRVKPVPASRPRVTKWGTYYLKTYKEYKDKAHAAIPVCHMPALDGELRATIEFVCHKPKSTKLVSPRGDIDNHIKAIFDVLVGQPSTAKQKCKLKGWIEDDQQFSYVLAEQRYAKPDEEPHTRIEVRRL